MTFSLPSTPDEYNALTSAAVKFVHSRSEEEQFKNLDGTHEDPIVGIGYILDAIGWPATPEMYMLLWLLQELRAHPHVRQHDGDECIEFEWCGVDR